MSPNVAKYGRVPRVSPSYPLPEGIVGQRCNSEPAGVDIYFGFFFGQAERRAGFESPGNDPRRGRNIRRGIRLWAATPWVDLAKLPGIRLLPAGATVAARELHPAKTDARTGADWSRFATDGP
jgi:hypothetical protein